MNYFLQVNAFLLFFYALYWLLLRRETFFRWNRGYLLLSVCLSLIIPLIKMPAFVQNTTRNIPIPAPIEQIMVLPTPIVNPTQTIQKKEQVWSIWEWSIMIYGSVFIILLLRFLLSLWWLWRLGRGKVWQAQEKYYLKHLPTSTQSFSFFNTLFLGDTSHLNEEQIQQIITHERAHIKQRHTWDIMILEFITITFWINPVGHYYKKSIRKVHEYLADKASLAYQNNKTAYANLVLKQASKK